MITYAFCLLCLAISFQQPQSPDLSAEQLITKIANSAAPLAIDGHQIRALNGLGDNAAVALTKALTGQHLTDTQITNSLLVLHFAFAGIDGAKGSTAYADRAPRTALFVLRALELQAPNSDLRRRVEETRQEITGHP